MSEPRLQIRKGVTLVEMLAVFAIIAVLVAFGLPRFGGIVERNSVSAARDQVISTLSNARAAAIRRGATSTFYVAGNDVWVTADSSGTEVTIVAKAPMNTLHGVTLATSGSASKVVYNSRGLASAASGKVYVTRGSRTDSVCITQLGAVMRQGCL